MRRAERGARSASRSCGDIPSASRSMTTLSLSRMRITIDSPRTTGSVATRRSTWRPSTARPMRPSCGTRRSAMSRLAMIFTRETSPATCWRGTVVESYTTPSMRKRTRMSLARGSKWMSEAPRRTASAITEWTSLTTGASSAWSRSSMTSASSSSSSTSSTASPSVRELADQRVDVLGRGDRAAHLVAGGHGDVVEREHVGRVGRRHQQRLLAEEGDRDRLVAARLGGVEQVGGAVVDLERRSGRRSRARCARRAPGRAGSSRRCFASIRA